MIKKNKNPIKNNSKIWQYQNNMNKNQDILAAVISQNSILLISTKFKQTFL